MLQAVTPSALVVTLLRCGAEVVDAGHWGGRGALEAWVGGAEGEGTFERVLGGAGGAVPAAEWVTVIHGWALGRAV